MHSPFGANTKTCPSEACATNSRPARSMVMPSGPLGPNSEQKRPTFETLPSFMNGRRQTALSRVIATNSTGLVGIEHQPVGVDAGIDQAVEPVVGFEFRVLPARLDRAGQFASSPAK